MNSREQMSVDDKADIAITIDTEWWGRANLVEGIPLHEGIDKDIESVYEILDLFASIDARATFFVVSDDFSTELLSAILRQGCEVASHSKTHPLFYATPYEQWREQVAHSKSALEDKTGVAVQGFRAPSWSVPFDEKDRFLDLLVQQGYRYDSSFCSFKTSLYGDPRFPRHPHLVGDDFVEIPLPRVGFPDWPWVGGFYFRVIPNFLLNAYIKRNRPAFLYFHPWEMYPGRKLQMSLMDSVITHYGRRTNKSKLRRFLSTLKKTHRFVPLGEIAERVREREKANRSL